MTNPPVAGPAIELTGLSRTFSTPRGTVHAVQGVDQDVRRGEVVVLLGPNGAGKTTTFDVVLGLTRPTAGTARVLGLPPRRAVAEGRVSAGLQTGGLLEDLSVAETVRMVAALHPHHAPVAEVLARAGIEDIARRRVPKCSGGQRQRLRLALALLPEPDLLILDEPTASMDVGARRTFWATMHAEAGRGRTVVFAAHHLEEADAFVWAFTMAPYLAALSAFRLPLRPALALLAVLLAVVVCVVLGGLLPPSSEWVLVMYLTSTVIIGGMRLAVHRDEQHAALASELALAHEREEVARDVHDILGHSLTVIALKAELARRVLDAEPERARAELDDVLRLARESLAGVRSTVGRLRTPDFAEQVEAARTALGAAGIKADVGGRDEAVAGPRRGVLAWALREAVTNVVRHSNASRCTVRWTPTTLTVADDGDGVLGPEGNGLRGLRGRVAQVGGTVDLRPGHGGEGTVLEVRVP